MKTFLFFGAVVILSQTVLLSCRKQDVLHTFTLPKNADNEKKVDKEDSTLPFYSEIEQFEKQDSIAFPPKNAIEFIGSSSIRLWNNINSYFPGFTIIQRGFGGSGLTDLSNYIN